MFAVVKTGGKQYKVSEGDIITVEKLDAEVGAEVDLGPVLMAGDGDKVEVGAPALDGKSVRATVLAQGKAPKIVIMYHRRRKNSRKKIGHRQPLTKLKITAIN